MPILKYIVSVVMGGIVLISHASATEFRYRVHLKGVAGVASAPAAIPETPEVGLSSIPDAPEGAGLAGGGWKLAWEANKNNLGPSDSKVWRSEIAPLLGDVSEVMIAYINPATRVLTWPHMFAMPASWRTTHPLVSLNTDIDITVTDLAHNVASAGILRYGTGDFGGATCASSWNSSTSYGRVCVMNSPNGQAPFYTGFAYDPTSLDQCSFSAGNYNNSACSDTVRFVIYVR